MLFICVSSEGLRKATSSQDDYSWDEVLRRHLNANSKVTKSIHVRLEKQQRRGVKTSQTKFLVSGCPLHSVPCIYPAVNGHLVTVRGWDPPLVCVGGVREGERFQSFPKINNQNSNCHAKRDLAEDRQFGMWSSHGESHKKLYWNLLYGYYILLSHRFQRHHYYPVFIFFYIHKTKS